MLEIVRGCVYCLTLSMLGYSVAGVASAETAETDLLWGGLAFSSSGESSLSPAAEELRVCAVSKECLEEDIFAKARDVFLSTSFKNVSIVRSTLAYNQRIGYVASPVVNSEFVVRGKSSGEYFYSFIILGNLIVYEVSPNDTSYIYSLPFGVQVDEFFDYKLTSAEEVAYLQNWYLTKDTERNFFNQLASHAEQRLYVPVEFSNDIKFTKIGFSDQVANVLEATAPLSSWKQTISSYAEARLAAQTGKPLIPSSLGESRLDLIFEDGSREVRLREPVYEFEIYVSVFDKQMPSSGWTCFNVGAFYTIESFGEILFDAAVVHGEESCAYLDAGAADPTSFFPANLFEQTDSVMMGFNSKKGSESYLKNHVQGDVQKVITDLRNFRAEVFND